MSRQPHKQRTRRREASLHERHDQLRAPLSAELREEYDRRNVRVNAGDTVEILRGDEAGETGEVTDVDLREETIGVEDVTVEKSDGEEVLQRLDASNVRVTELNLDDDRRAERIEGGSD